MPVLNLAAHNIMNPAGSNMPRRIRVSRKTELDRIRKLLAAKKPEPEEAPEPCICFRFQKQEYKIAISTILYATMQKGIIYIHTVDGTIYRERTSLRIMEEQLGDGFLKINLSTLAAVRYIREISDKIWLSNGEGLSYVVRNKRRFMKRIVDEKRKRQSTMPGRIFPKRRKNTGSITKALSICHLPLQIPKWCLMIHFVRWTGYSGMAILHSQSLRNYPYMS